VREQLLAAIQRGDYAPGDLLPSERVLCETFGISRVSVREAIAGLESTGLVRVEHGRGVFVSLSVNDAYIGPFVKYLELHQDELVDLLKVRGALDELAAVEASTSVTPESTARLQEAADGFKVATEAVPIDMKEVSRLDVAFHTAIASVSMGKLLPRLIGELNGVLEESRLITLSRPGQLLRSVAEHQAIVDAIISGNARAARLAVKAHIGHIREWVDGFAPAPPAR
jgi:DNA-binding FadR family transcriptional regulator